MDEHLDQPEDENPSLDNRSSIQINNNAGSDMNIFSLDEILGDYSKNEIIGELAKDNDDIDLNEGDSIEEKKDMDILGNEKNDDEMNNMEIDKIIEFKDVVKEEEENSNEDAFQENYEIEKIEEEDNNKNNNNNKIKNLCQYYLFLAYHLEGIKSDKYFLDKFNKDMFEQVKYEIDINKYIFKLYKEAFLFSGEKHRDYPYFLFYSFLISLNPKEISSLANKDDIWENQKELYEIYFQTLNEKRFKGIFKKKFCINDLEEFNPKAKPTSPNVLSFFCLAFSSLLPKKETIEGKSVERILNETFDNINKEEVIKELLGELRDINLDMLKKEKEKLCFWLNAFNFLLFFTIFYLKLNIKKKFQKNVQNFWKAVFKNVQFNLGGNKFSFEDMMYIIFRKNVFFPSDIYFPNNQLSKYVIDPSKDKDFLNDKIYITPFLLFLPNNAFCQPVIYDISSLEKTIAQRNYNFILDNVKFDKNSDSIKVNQLIISFDPKFLEKIKEKKNKYYNDLEFSKLVQNKKYKLVVEPMNWEISFDFLSKTTK